MSEVKRLKLYHSKHEDMTYPVEAENGSFVLHSDYTTLLARHNALGDAVKKEQSSFKVYYSWLPRRTQQDWENWKAARAEVDRLLLEESK